MEKIIPEQIEIQKSILNILSKKFNIFPFSVFHTKLQGELCSITFFGEDDLEELLEKINYYNLCDNSNVFVYKEYNTVVLTRSGISLLTSHII